MVTQGEQTNTLNMDKLYEVIVAVHSRYADDICWMAIDEIFIAAMLPVPDRSVGDKVAMLTNCQRYIDGMCKEGKWVSYADLESENTKLKQLVSDLLDEVMSAPYNNAQSKLWDRSQELLK